MTAPRYRYGVSLEDLGQLLADRGEPRYRAQQVFDGLYEQRSPLEELTNLPKRLRTELAELLPLALSERVRSTGDDGATTKWLWDAAGAQIETVLMEYRSRATVCVSSQAGCAMGCTFCATGQAGFERHLRADEIVEQVLRAQHATTMRVSNVVFMGMGEPLANFDAVWAAIEVLHRDLGISARHITVSTVGIVPGIKRLTALALPVTLAVSLHAPDDTLRDELVPPNRRYPVQQVVDAARAHAAATGRRVTFEYACIARVNDQLYRADALAELLARFPGGAHVNLIPLNRTEGYSGRDPGRTRMLQFAQRLTERGISATVRRNRGTEIDAACGQLRARNL
jgi:23S rRNA (adenine2503-C2)-methyltransferase